MDQSILLVSSPTKQLSTVRKILADFGFSVFQADSVSSTKAGLALHSPAFLLVDLDVRGFEEILTGLLTGNCVRPFTLASADFHESRKRAAILKMGADICAGNPVDAEEILAVIHAVQRRERWLMQLHHHQHSPRISYKDLTIDPIRRRTTMRGKIIDLTAKEFDILYLLAQKQGHVLTKEEIYRNVWDTDVGLDASAVTGYVSSICQKLGFQGRHTGYLRTVIGVGYCLGWLDGEQGTADK